MEKHENSLILNDTILMGLINIDLMLHEFIEIQVSYEINIDSKQIELIYLQMIYMIRCDIQEIGIICMKIHKIFKNEIIHRKKKEATHHRFLFVYEVTYSA